VRNHQLTFLRGRVRYEVLSTSSIYPIITPTIPVQLHVPEALFIQVAVAVCPTFKQLIAAKGFAVKTKMTDVKNKLCIFKGNSWSKTMAENRLRMKKTRRLRDGNRNTGRRLHVLVLGFLLKGHRNVKGTFGR